MKHVTLVEEVPFEKVDWGLTKNLVGPVSTDSKFLKINITRYLPGFVHEPHVHPDQEEVIFVISGRGVSETDYCREEIGPGSVVFIPAGTRHATSNLSQEEDLEAIIIKSPPDN